MPFLNDEVKEWIGMELRSLGVEDLAVYAVEAGAEGDERRVIVATEVGILDHRYAPFGSSARYRLAMLLYPWQVLRGVELRADTFRLWAMEHRTRWSFKLHYPVFEASTESPDLGQALCDLARVCAVMAEPFGVPAARSAGHETTTAALEVGGRAHPRPAPGPTATDDGSGAEAASPTPLDTVAGGNAPEAERMEAAAVAASTAGDEISTEGHAKPRAGAEPRARAEPQAEAESSADLEQRGEAEESTPAEPPEEPALEASAPRPEGDDAPGDESLEEQIGMVEMDEPPEDEREG